MVHPNTLYNALRQLDLKPNEEMHLTEAEKERLLVIYEKVVLDYFRALFPRPTKQNFIRKYRDEHRRVLVDIICRSCGKQVTVNNQRRVFCPAPAPCKNQFNGEKRSLFSFLDDHALDLANRLEAEPNIKALKELFKGGD